MSLSDVYEGRIAWADYLSRQAGLADQSSLLTEPQKAEPSLKLSLSKREYRAALTGGLGALHSRARNESREALQTLEVKLAALAGGVAQLNADFTPLLGDVVWKLEMQQSALLDVLQEIRLAEFEREARAYRTRAERAYLNGWYPEALRDFLKAEKRNYPDYVVLRSIANIYLYHSINLPKALAYFHKAAKYARPYDSRPAAEAHYFAGVICVIEHQLEAALAQFQEAVRLYPQFYEAHYQRAGVAALLGRVEESINSLELAISGDARYYERAKIDPLFDGLKPQVEALLERLVQPVEEHVEQMKRDAAQLQGYVIAESEREKINSIFQQVEQQQSADATYLDRLQMLEQLTQFHEEMQRIHERFDKRYEIDPRDYVRSIAFSHGGQWLAAGFLNGGVQLWEVDSMQQLHIFSGRQSGAHFGLFGNGRKLPQYIAVIESRPSPEAQNGYFNRTIARHARRTGLEFRNE